MFPRQTEARNGVSRRSRVTFLLTLCLLSREPTPAYIPWGRQFFGLGRHIASRRYFPLKAVLQEIFSHFDLVKGL